MKTTAVRLYGVKDLRLETFELPEIKPNEILAKVISDSVCMSSYKAANQGTAHKRVPKNVDTHPVMIGHEFCCELISIGSVWQSAYQTGQKYVIQPALNYQGSLDAPGYSYPFIGGNATYVVIPAEVMIMDCLLPYDGEAYFMGSMAEPFSCVAGAMHESFHTNLKGHIHDMDIKAHGSMAILAGAGPMGLAAIEYAINRDIRPKRLVVTDIDDQRLKRASGLITSMMAKERGIDLHYVNTKTSDDPVRDLLKLNEGQGYDDVFIFAPVPSLVRQADQLLGRDGCLNFFAGPTNSDFSVELNFYNVHYEAHKVTGTSGGTTADMAEVLELFAAGKVRPEIMVSHVGGLDSVIPTTLNLPLIDGAKKLVYTQISMPMTAIGDFKSLGERDSLFRELAIICDKHGGLWNAEAEAYLLTHGKTIDGGDHDGQ
ncbi:MAG: zinc-binding dehydrogenase [Acholeplasmataceae bacterium]|nr:zinc-binding dehydrogenase [Acholeplasmataceae bacterium]